MSTHFLWPEALPLLLLVPLAGLSFWALDRARARRLAPAVGPRAPMLAPVRRRRVWFTLALLCAVLAVLQPAWGGGARALDSRGLDILVCLDVSRSMLARDLEPSRLERARREISALAERTEGDRLGLVVFAGDARLAVPLTRDMDSFRELVGLAGPLSVMRGGTDLGAALSTALGSGDPDVVLLLTDGEDHEGKGRQVAETAGVPVHCVGLGSRRGAKIPVDGAFLRDRTGAEVVSALDPATLRRIAAATGGSFRDAHARPRALVELYEERILPMARETLEAKERRERENRFQWPLLAAFLFLMVDLWLHDRRR